MKEISPKVKFGFQFSGFFMVYSFCLIFLEIYEIRKEFIERSDYLATKVASELNRGIWSTRLALLEVERRKTKELYQKEWHFFGLEKIQALSQFRLNIVPSREISGNLKNTNLDLTSNEFQVLDLPEIFIGYIVDFHADEIATPQTAAALYSKKLNLKLFVHKSLIAPNLVLLVGLAPHIDFLYILKRIQGQALLGLLIFLIFSSWFVYRHEKTRKLAREQAEHVHLNSEKYKSLKSSFNQTRFYQKETANYFMETLQSINELTNILIESKKKDSKVIFSPYQEVEFVNKIHDLSSIKLQNFVYYNLEKINIRDLISEIVTLFFNEADDKDVNISLEIGEDEEIYYDKFRLKIFILNLLYRSILNCPKGGQIKISSLQNQNNNFNLFLEDDGYENIQKSNMDLDDSIFILSLKELDILANQLDIWMINNYKPRKGNNLRVCLFQQMDRQEEISEKEESQGNVYKLHL
jgi:signal transduction histidine kinase